MSEARLNCAGFVLAGGHSRRMGADKALVELAGRPLIAHALDTLRAAGLNAAIAGAHADVNSYASIIPDAEPDCGPLGGICSALEQCDAEIALFVSVDMPLMPVSAIHYLVEHAAMTAEVVTVFSVNGFAQTFPSVIRREAAPVLRAELAAGRRGCLAALDKAAGKRAQRLRALPVEYLAQAGQVRDDRGLPPVRWFANLNTQQDMARAAQWLQATFA
ncbi:MAG: molybdenum cofactor guanylyltransferase [Acidobacteriota bacterium]